MKKVGLVVLLMVVILLVGCSSSIDEMAKESNSENERFSQVSEKTFTITKDNESGCKYIVYNGYKNGGITPLLKSDGTPDCNNNEG